MEKITVLLSTKRKSPYMVYTVEECLRCHVKNKRLFTNGDYVFRHSGSCSQCGGEKSITMIYSEALQPNAKKLDPLKRILRRLMLIGMTVPLNIGDKFSNILSKNDELGLIIQVSIAILILSLYFFLWLKKRL